MTNVNWPAPGSAQPVNIKFKRHVKFHRGEAGEVVIDLITSDFTDEERGVLERWFPKLIGQPSGPVATPSDIITHPDHVLQFVAHLQAKKAKEEKKERRVVKKARDAGYCETHKNWVQACKDRKEAIEAANVAWREAVATRKAAIMELDEKVRQAREVYQAAKAAPAPVMPEKN